LWSISDAFRSIPKHFQAKRELRPFWPKTNLLKSEPDMEKHHNAGNKNMICSNCCHGGVGDAHVHLGWHRPEREKNRKVKKLGTVFSF
jgi:hypothetical protein